MLHAENASVWNAVTVDATGNPLWTFPLHSHDHHVEVSLVLAGAGTLYYDGHSYPMCRGDVIVKNAGVIHAEQTNRDDPLRQVCLSFSGVYGTDGRPDCLLPHFMSPVLCGGADFGILSAAFSCLADHWQDEAYSVICRHLTEASLEIISGLIARQQSTGTKEKPDSRVSETVTQITDWLNDHYMQKITLQELADRFFISPYYLDRKFKACVGYSINQYVIDRRMGEAQRMLIFEDRSIKEIALAVGYGNLQYFYATFKKYTGKSPSVFRREFRPD